MLIRRAKTGTRGQYPWNKTRCTQFKTINFNNILLKPLFLWLHTLTSSKTSIEFQYNEALIDVFHEWSTSKRPLKGQVIDNLTKKLIKQHNICHDRYNFQDGSICIISRKTNTPYIVGPVRILYINIWKWLKAEGNDCHSISSLLRNQKLLFPTTLRDNWKEVII